MLTHRNVNIAFMLTIIALMVSDNYSELSWWPYLILIIFYFGLQAYGSIVLSAQYFVPVLIHGDKRSKEVSLTFDDGPVQGKTDRILDILRTFQAPATFFCIGNRIKASPDLLSRIHVEGHLVGNHSYWHGKTFDLQSAGAIRKELNDTDVAVREVISFTPKFFRPPYGVTNPMVANAIKAGNYKAIGWSIRSMDTVTKDSAKLFRKVTSSLKGGDIILFHDFCESTIEVLPALLKYLHENGFKIVRLDKLLNEEGYA